MILTTKQMVEAEILTDVICDICKKSCKREMDYEYGRLTASWGYSSNKDGYEENYELCEDCFDAIVEGRLCRKE